MEYDDATDLNLSQIPGLWFTTSLKFTKAHPIALVNDAGENLSY